MDRRSVLRMLAVSGVLLSSLTRKVARPRRRGGRRFAPRRQRPRRRKASASPPTGASSLPGNGRPSTRACKPGSTPPLRDASPIDLGGINVARSGKIETGKLDPVGISVELPPELAGIVTPADEALSLEVLNRDFNPFLADPRGPGGTPLHRTVHGGRRALSGQDAAAGPLHRRQDGRGRRHARACDQAADRRAERDRGDPHAGASVPLGRRPRQSRRVLRRDLGQRHQDRDRAHAISTRSCSSWPSRISG